MKPITYSLLHEHHRFYDELSSFTDRVLEKAKLLLPPIADYEDYVIAYKGETGRSAALYQLELLSMALYWQNYGDVALGISKEVADLSCRLLYARAQYPECKRQIDTVRGILNFKYLWPKALYRDTGGTTHVERFALDPDRLATLIRWMAATGEFKEECRRFDTWQSYLETVPLYRVRSIFRGAAVLAHWFKEESLKALGRYTENVEPFREAYVEKYQNREDHILCGRKRSDYHLIMVGADIMNRHLASSFLAAEEKLALLPGCMRPVGHRCRANGNGDARKCEICHPACAIGNIARQGQGRFEVRVVEHASDFTAALKRWAGQKDVGLVASACVLHLFTGGYEMLNLGIPSQCIFLNHCGCRKHWHEIGISTGLDVTRLEEIVAGAAPCSRCGDEKPTPRACLNCA